MAKQYILKKKLAPTLTHLTCTQVEIELETSYTGESLHVDIDHWYVPKETG